MKVALILLVVIALFLAYVSTRQSQFSYSRSGVIQAPPEKIFPYLSHFKLASLWSPYEKKDPGMKKQYLGTDGQVGSKLIFDGNRESSSGELEILKIVPNESVNVRLLMTKPFKADHLVQYQLTPEGKNTRFTWTMSGDGGFMNKLITVFIDCEKLVAKDFEPGILNLKTLVESQK